MKVLYSGRQIYNLIPQRPPIVMIDTIYKSEDTICTALTITSDNIFVSKGRIEETGLIEHIAQTAAAMAGYEVIAKQEPPRIGYIGEIKNFVCYRLPEIDEIVHTSLSVIAQLTGVTLVETTTCIGNETIATCQMKIFIQESNIN